MDVTDRELTQFLEKILKVYELLLVLFIVSASVVAIIYLHFFEDRNSKYLRL